MSLTPKQFDELIITGAQRLLGRAEDARSLNAEALAKRLSAATGKYVLKDDPSADSTAIDKFLDRGAWNDTAALLTGLTSSR